MHYGQADIFNGFVSLRELDLSLSDVRGITLSTEAFLQLQVLNLAYNNLCDADILALGKLKCIRILNLSSNQLSTLPENLAVRDWHGGSAYFRSLEELTLESNYLSGESTFFCLAGLPRLKHLNLRGNGLCAVPHLSIKDSCFKADEVKGLTVLHKKVNKGTQKATRHTTITALSNQGLHDSNDAQAFVSRSAQYIGAMNYLGLSLQVVKHAVTPACIKPHSHESKETITTNLQLKQKNSESSGIAQEKQPTENLGLLKNENEEHYINISKPAFPCLQYLDLSCNKVRDEKCLLAIASYPMLTELVLYGNPLATNTKGCPPLLEHCLANRLGITIVREKPMPESRVHLQTRNVMSRQVKKKIHSVPDKSLMLKQDQIECISGKEISPEKYSGTEITEIMTFNYAPDHPHVTCSHQPRQPSYHQQQCPGDLVNKFERTQEVLATQTFAPSQDMNLDSIMDKHPSSKEYKDAMRLLQRVQTKYYSACNSSVQYSRKARAFAEINAYTPVSE
ncbi:PREDICTED: leucine-rich repeat-containing protein 32-like [Priapulus caudatus]|uniref:Leucine-rich repeat-containing protein 32-like n=1 Tax=Priapulus caudatus TaxID=37621 RepID=A0ABM1DWY4_PRICU|nr:PREDICTED: leucine-rich repeat-containing protein 32-like [Priapulus caudatus]